VTVVWDHFWCDDRAANPVLLSFSKNQGAWSSADSCSPSWFNTTGWTDFISCWRIPWDQRTRLATSSHLFLDGLFSLISYIYKEDGSFFHRYSLGAVQYRLPRSVRLFQITDKSILHSVLIPFAFPSSWFFVESSATQEGARSNGSPDLGQTSRWSQWRTELVR
jgi:hypothetical protein